MHSLLVHPEDVPLSCYRLISQGAIADSVSIRYDHKPDCTPVNMLKTSESPCGAIRGWVDSRRDWPAGFVGFR